MLNLIARKEWSGTGVLANARLDKSLVKGIAVHYPGSPGDFSDNSPSFEKTLGLVRGELEFHVKVRKWQDVAYNYAIDQAGRVFEMRGVKFRSAANGGARTNKQYLAVTFLVGLDDEPTAAAVEAFKTLRATVLAEFPAAVDVVCHGDLYSTECPGAHLRSLVRDGTLRGAPSTTTTPVEDDDMPTAAEVASEVWNRFEVPGTGKKPLTVLADLLARVAKLEGRTGDTVKQ